MDNIFNTIKDAYQSLWRFKDYGNTLEIVTPVATINDIFVSVFITKRGNDYVVTDGGWIDDGLYECEVPWNLGIYQKIGSFFVENLQIQSTEAKGKKFYFKKIDRLELLPNLVFDMANFINAIISTSNIQYVTDREELTFRKRARGYLRKEFGDDKFEFDKTISEETPIKFNAINRDRNGINLINFVSGSTSNYYTNSICRSDMNFKMIQPLHNKYNIRRTITLLDDSKKSIIESTQVQTYFNYLLDKRDDKNKVVLWSQSRDIESAIA